MAAELAWFGGEREKWLEELDGDEHAKMTLIKTIYKARYSKYEDAA